MKVDVDLIDRCKANERYAQNELYRLMLPFLKAVCRRYIIKNEDVNDALQESFILIFKKIDLYDTSKGSFYSWAVRITINATINYNQRISVINEEEFLPELHDTNTSPEAYLNMSNGELLEIIKRMPKEHFYVFNLYVIDCFQHQEIAELLGINVSLSRKRLSRGRSWLQQEIAKMNEQNIRK